MVPPAALPDRRKPRQSRRGGMGDEPKALCPPAAVLDGGLPRQSCGRGMTDALKGGAALLPPFGGSCSRPAVNSAHSAPRVAPLRRSLMRAREGRHSCRPLAVHPPPRQVTPPFCSSRAERVVPPPQGGIDVAGWARPPAGASVRRGTGLTPIHPGRTGGITNPVHAPTIPHPFPRSRLRHCLRVDQHPG